MTIRQLTCVWISLAIATVSHGHDWTRFRGPNGTGVSDTVLPATWTDKEILFNVALPGIGHSSPVVRGDQVYLLSADPETAKQFVLCFDATTGQKRWQREFELAPYHIHQRNSFASVTPAVDDDHVYVAWSTPENTTTMALDHQGNTVWKRDLGPFASQHGFGSSPIVYDDLVIICHLQKKPKRDGPRTETSSVVAIDRLTGEIRWRTKRMSEVVSYSVPTVLRRDGKPDELICCSTADGIFSLDPRTGKENWKNEVFSMRTVSSPQIAGGLIFGTTGSGAGGNYVVAIKVDDPSTEAYRITRQAPYVPTPVMNGNLGFLWFDKGIVTCIDIATGKPHWQKRIGGNFSGSPVIAGDKIYCISEDGQVYVLAAKNKFQLLGKNPLGEDSRSTPAIANGRIYFRTYSRLICVGPDAEA